MKKKVWMILLAVMLVFGLAMLGCPGTGGGGESDCTCDDDADCDGDCDPCTCESGGPGGGGDGVVLSLTDYTLTLEANAYGKQPAGQTASQTGIEGFQATIEIEEVLNKDEIYTLEIEFTSNRAITEDLFIGLFKLSGYDWVPLTWYEDDEESGNYIASAEVTGTVEKTIEFMPLLEAGSATNQMVFRVDEIQGGNWTGPAGEGNRWQWEYQGTDEPVLTITSLTLSYNTETVTPLESVAISGPNAVLVGSTITLTPVYTPGNATDIDTVVWSSSDTTKATVAGGVVTGVAEGTSTIKVVVNGDKEATHTVTINAPPAGNLVLFDGDDWLEDLGDVEVVFDDEGAEDAVIDITFENAIDISAFSKLVIAVKIANGEDNNWNGGSFYFENEEVQNWGLPTLEGTGASGDLEFDFEDDLELDFNEIGDFYRMRLQAQYVESFTKIELVP